MERDDGNPDDAGSSLRGRLEDNTLPALLAIAAASLVIRVDGLGQRVAHYDEGRVAYDAIRYGETGLWEYRSIVHGPFLPHVNDLVFSVLGPTDFAMRLVVALVGAALPLVPWLFREHLNRLEVLAVSVFLAFEPVLVYYSRFMRNDVLVATFMLFSLGLFVRFLDTRRVRYLYAGVALGALGFTTKENAVIYVLCWLGAGALLVDATLYRPNADESTRSVLARRYRDARRRARAIDLRDRALYYGGHAAFAVVLGGLILVYFYAPRTGGTGVGFERLAGQPTAFPEVADRAFGAFWDGLSEWGDKGTGDSGFEDFPEFLGGFVDALVAYSPGLVAFAIAGLVGERYFADRPRGIVMLFGYWGLVSLPGYALGTDIWATWGLVHVLVPLAFPAGVALAAVVRWGFDAVADLRAGTGTVARSGDAVLSVTIAAVLVCSMLAITAGTAFDPTNVRGTGEYHIVQYAQPNQEVRETLDDVESVVEATDDPVVYYGQEYAIDNESAAYRPPVEDRWETGEDGERRRVEDNGGWYSRLPMPWYTERADAETLSAHDPEELDRLLLEAEPAVIVAQREYEDTDNEAIVDERAGDYVKITHRMRSPGRETVFYLREDALESVGESDE